MSSTRIPANGSFSIAFLSIFAVAAIPRVHILQFRAGIASAARQHLACDLANLAHDLEVDIMFVSPAQVVRS
jgi:hypothetical protein